MTWVKLSDVRFSKSLRLKGGSLEGMVDVFNLFNSSVVLRRVTTNGPNIQQAVVDRRHRRRLRRTRIPAARVFRTEREVPFLTHLRILRGAADLRRWLRPIAASVEVHSRSARLRRCVE
jgi:hypothetical protein